MIGKFVVHESPRFSSSLPSVEGSSGANSAGHSKESYQMSFNCNEILNPSLKATQMTSQTFAKARARRKDGNYSHYSRTPSCSYSDASRNEEQLQCDDRSKHRETGGRKVHEAMVRHGAVCETSSQNQPEYRRATAESIEHSPSKQTFPREGRDTSRCCPCRGKSRWLRAPKRSAN